MWICRSEQHPTLRYSSLSAQAKSFSKGAADARVAPICKKP